MSLDTESAQEFLKGDKTFPAEIVLSVSQLGHATKLQAQALPDLVWFRCMLAFHSKQQDKNCSQAIWSSGITMSILRLGNRL